MKVQIYTNVSLFFITFYNLLKNADIHRSVLCSVPTLCLRFDCSFPYQMFGIGSTCKKNYHQDLLT